VTILDLRRESLLADTGQDLFSQNEVSKRVACSPLQPGNPCNPGWLSVRHQPWWHLLHFHLIEEIAPGGTKRVYEGFFHSNTTILEISCKTVSLRNCAALGLLFFTSPKMWHGHQPWRYREEPRVLAIIQRCRKCFAFINMNKKLINRTTVGPIWS